MNSIFRQLVAVLLIVYPGTVLAVELNVLRTSDVDSSALNFSESAASFSQNINGRTYQRSPMSTFNGYQYTTYYDGNRNVCLARRPLRTDAWEIIRFNDYDIPGNDSHNVVSLGICHLDGTIHLAFDHHVDPLNYRVSEIGVASNPEAVVWSADLFGSITNRLGSAGSVSSVTYPTFFNAPNGNLMLYYRNRGSGNGDGMIQEYDGSTHDWTTGLGKFIARTGSYSGVLSTNSTSRNPYLNGISYAGDRIHVSWGWRENSGGSQFNHDLNYAYSDDDGRTWRNSAGSQIGITDSSFITVDSPGLVVVPIPQGSGLSNQYTHYAYPDGSCHVVVAHNESGTSTRRYHHYWRNAAGDWSGEVIPFVGTRPKLVGDDDRSLFLAYNSGNQPKVAKGTSNASRTSWSWSEIHTQSDTTEGGDGHIDYTRWEFERILTFYGQEKSNEDGDSSALHVFDYQVSGKAILPTPIDTQTEVPESSSLQWVAGIDSISHRIYLGTDPVAVVAATPTSPEYFGQQEAATFTPSVPLDSFTTYYWRVDEVDTASVVHGGLLWSFTTAGNEPPVISEIADQLFIFGSAIDDIAFSISDDQTPANSLILTATSSNPALLTQAGISIVGSGVNRSLQVVPVAGVTGETTITVTADDGNSQGEESFALKITGPVYELFSKPEDASVREVLNVVDIDRETTLLGTGGSSPRVDRCTLYVFKLPDFGAGDSPFSSASFNFEYVAKQSELQDNDLYGLSRRTLPDVLASDYYGKSDTVDPAAIFLEASILTNDTDFGIIATDLEGQSALRDYLNLQYASGAGAGLHVFLRLNTAGYEDGIDRATLTMSEGGSASPVDTRPKIIFTSNAFPNQQIWRTQHFGSPFNSGEGADGADPNNDGESNFLEYATGQDPHSATIATITVALAGDDIELSYQRNANAVADGYTYTLEWSDSLQSESWNPVGVSELIESETGSPQAVVATVPDGSAARRFVRLRIDKP